MPTTTRGLRYPSSSAAPNVPQDIQNLAADVERELPGKWTFLVTSANNYLYDLSETWSTPPGMSYSLVVPNDRELEVEFRSPAVYVNAGFAHMRLMLGGVQQDLSVFSAPGEVWTPCRLSGSVTGTGASVPILVQGLRTTGVASVRGVESGPVTIRYRIS